MKHHDLHPRPGCKATMYGGNNSTHRSGNPCNSQESVENGLCWLHRKVVEIRGVDVEKVLRGER